MKGLFQPLLLSFVACSTYVVATNETSASVAMNRPVVWSTASFEEDDLPCDRPVSPFEFNLEKRRTPDNAYLLMAASHLAYRFWPGRREQILSRLGFLHWQLFDNQHSNTNGYWAEHATFVLLVFRGTQEPYDLLTDVNVSLEDVPAAWNADGRVHQGFLHAALSVESHAVIAAQHAQRQRKPLIVAGHSLGGAVALMTAMQLEAKKLPVHTLWTFGSPKSGDLTFSRTAYAVLKERWQKLNQPVDPIPLLPFGQKDQPLLDRVSERFAGRIPLIEKLASNAAYDTHDIFADKKPERPSITQTPALEIARGFMKHLPRAYVCDLANRRLSVH